MGRASMQFVTFLQGDPTNLSITNVQGIPMTMGQNYANWRTFFQSRGLVVDTQDLPTVHVFENTGANTVQLRGAAPLHLASACRYAFFGHHIPRFWEDQIEGLSRIGTKVGDYFINVEAAGLARELSLNLQVVQDINKTFVLAPKVGSGCIHNDLVPIQNGWTAYKCNVINQYEHSFPADFQSGQSTCAAVYVANAAACPHTPVHNSLPSWSTGGSLKMSFDSDMLNSTFLQQHAAAVRALDNIAGRKMRRKLCDNMKQRPFKGSAIPNYPDAYTESAYVGQRNDTVSLRTGWKGYMQNLQEQYLGTSDDFIWANTLDPQGELGTPNYTAQDIMNRFVEHFFLSNTGSGLANLAELTARFDAIATAGVRCIMNIEPGPTQNWALANGDAGATWQDIFLMLVHRGLLQRVYACCARNILFDQPLYFESLT